MTLIAEQEYQGDFLHFNVSEDYSTFTLIIRLLNGIFGFVQVDQNTEVEDTCKNWLY